MSQSKENIQKEFFGELFGFKSGDRVKIKRKVYGRHLKWYWKYGIIISVSQTSVFGDYPYRVKWDGERYSSTYSARDLIKVRPYGKET